MWRQRSDAIATIRTAHPDWSYEQAVTAWTNEKDAAGNFVHENWNKVILVPISYEKSSSSTTPTRIGHDMSLTSTRLVGGKDSPISIEVVYGKFNK